MEVTYFYNGGDLLPGWDDMDLSIDRASTRATRLQFAALRKSDNFSQLEVA
jgi:hypothetical protein